MKKTICKITVVMMLIAFVYPLKSQAALQANEGGKSLTGKNANQFFTSIREMETKNGTLGKEAILDIEKGTYIDTTEGGNGLDCHMAKNTEWGTMAMLAVSDYGEAPIGYGDDVTTTGNKSGVCQIAQYNSRASLNLTGYELVAGIWSEPGDNEKYIKTIRNANSKYYDLYTEEASKPGDATLETKGWEGAYNSNFIFSRYGIFCRNFVGKLFDYNYHDGYQILYRSYTRTASARAVVVCADGI